jgi:transposase-like protein
LVKWFCRHLTFNELCSAIAILHEVLAGIRKGFELKPEEVKSPHYRQFRVDPDSPLTEPPDPRRRKPTANWRTLIREYRAKHGKALSPVRRRTGSGLPEGARCEHCHAPGQYLYLNDGKNVSQVRCKVCSGLSQIRRVRKGNTSNLWCPHCGGSLYLWKDRPNENIFKCGNDKCPHYLKNISRLTPEERAILATRRFHPNFKLRYQYRVHDFRSSDLECARPETTQGFDRIHSGIHEVALTLAYSVNLGLSSRQTRNALRHIHGIRSSHQTVLNRMKTAANLVAPLVDRLTPKPEGIAALDETYIIVDGKWHYTWFGIDQKTRAICGYNLSDSRGTQPAMALLCDCFGKPKDATPKTKGEWEVVTDGNPSYDSALLAYNSLVDKEAEIRKHTVIGLRNLDPESREYRKFKQTVERLNRTYKFHTRPRSGFKNLEGAVALTTLFVAYYNFMRPHLAVKAGAPPVRVPFIEQGMFYQEMWKNLLEAA